MIKFRTAERGCNAPVAFVCLAIYLLIACAASAQMIAVQGTLTDGSGGAVAGSFLRFQLWNCGQNFPTYAGSGLVIVQKQFDLPVNSSGQVSGQVIPNDQISCGGIASTRWLVTPFKDDATPLNAAQRYNICSATAIGSCGNTPGGTFNPSTAQADTAQAPQPGFTMLFANPIQSQTWLQPAGTTGFFKGAFDFTGATVKGITSTGAPPISINGVPLPGAVTTANFNATQPAAQGGFLNCSFQSDVSGDISAECPFGSYLALTGGTLSGTLTLATDPVSGLQAATKEYVDGTVSGFVGVGANNTFTGTNTFTQTTTFSGDIHIGGNIIQTSSNPWDLSGIILSGPNPSVQSGYDFALGVGSDLTLKCLLSAAHGGGSCAPSGGGFSGEAINPQTATYQVTATDFSSYKTITVASGTFTITLPPFGAGGSTQPPNGQFINVWNYGSGVVTIARSGQNINGGTASLVLGPGCSATTPCSATVASNGTDYLAAVPGSGGNFAPLGTVGTPVNNTWYGNQIFGTDNTYNIGASGGNRPANVYAGTGVFASAGKVTGVDYGASPLAWNASGVQNYVDSASNSSDTTTDVFIAAGGNTGGTGTSYHTPLRVWAAGFQQFAVCNPNLLGFVEIGNIKTGGVQVDPCATISTNNKLVVANNSPSHTEIALLQNSVNAGNGNATGTQLNILNESPSSGSYNFIQAWSGVTANDGTTTGGTLEFGVSAAGNVTAGGNITYAGALTGSNASPTQWSGKEWTGPIVSVPGGYDFSIGLNNAGQFACVLPDGTSCLQGAVFTVFGRAGNVLAQAPDYAAFYAGLTSNNTLTGIDTFQQAPVFSYSSLHNTGTSSCLFVTATGQVQGTGSACTSGLTLAGSPFAIQYQNSGATNLAGLNSPTSNGVYNVVYNVVGGIAVAPSAVLPGTAVDAQTGSYSLLCPGDRNGEVEFNITSPTTLTVPQAGSTTCLGTNITATVRNAISSTAVLTVSLTTSTFQPEGGSTHKVLPGGALLIFSDAGGSTGNYHAIDVAPAEGGVNVQSTSYTATAADRNALIVMNCGSACGVTLPAAPPTPLWTTKVMSIGTTLATINLNSLTFNAGASAPALIKYMPIEIRTDGSNWFGSAPLIAGTNITFTPGANGITVSSSGGGAGVSSFTGDGGFFNNSLSTGAVTATLASVAANKLWAGPASGSAAASAARFMVPNDLPAPCATAGCDGIWNNGTPAGTWMDSQSTGTPSAGTVLVFQVEVPAPHVVGHATYNVTTPQTSQLLYTCIYHNTSGAADWAASATAASSGVQAASSSQFTMEAYTQYYVAVGQSSSFTAASYTAWNNGAMGTINSILATQGNWLSSSSSSITSSCPSSLGTLTALTGTGNQVPMILLTP